jgi:site-specific DNA-methyltransferase (adenine-specific)
MSALLINANALNIPLADKSVQCVVTSPPYYGLRDYGVGGQIGLEVTPDEYIANLVAVFREVKRVLKDDGTLWVNIGDSYTSMKSRYNQKAQNLNGGKSQDNEFQGNKTDLYHHPELGLKDKDLIGIPWMLAFALRADGWYLRQDIIWAKPNPMPESVKDRCTKSHEYIFLLSKSAKYYYDNEAVMEDAAGGRERFGGAKYGDKGLDKSRNDTARFDETIVSVRNKRSVWTVTTKPYKGAHYATFNPDLIKPCILAGAPEGGIVFDPFVGSGTTVATAVKLGRRGVGLDLSMKYLRENARERIYQEEMQPVLCTREEVM